MSPANHALGVGGYSLLWMRIGQRPGEWLSLAAMPPILLRFLLAVLLTAPVLADEATPTAHPPYEKRAEHDPNGIGVFYLDREIAHVMGHQAADWLERPEREEEERTDLLIDSLKFHEGE